MRIGLVLPRPPGGSETFFRTKIRALQVAGHEVFLFPNAKGKAMEAVPTHRAPQLAGPAGLRLFQLMLGVLLLFIRAPGSAIRFWRLERKAGRIPARAFQNLYLNSHILPHRLDWLHFGFATMSIHREHTGAAIGARVGVSLRGYDLHQFPLKQPKAYHLFWQQADRIHTLSDALTSRARQLGLPRQTSLVRIPPAVDTHFFRRENPEPEFRNPCRMLTLARVHWVKGMECTLEALALLKAAGVAFRYKIVGAGGDYERLVFAVHQLGLQDEVTIQSPVPHRAVASEMEGADIYLQYSLQEGFGNAVLEAQAMGLLCIVSDAGGLPENVLDGQTGWVVPRRCPRHLARRIQEVVQMPREQRELVQQRAIRRVREAFSFEHHRRQWNAFFTDEL